MKGLVKNVAVSLLILCSSAVFAMEEEVEVDPWQGFNRAMFSFNEALDENVLLPVTKGYKAVTPDPVEKGVYNFFSNLGDVGGLFNALLQLKFEETAHITARLVANTVFGIGGIFDVATPLGLEKKYEDFGQTLGYWGVESGPYLVLPFFGPSSARDGVGKIFDFYLDPVNHLEDDEARLTLKVIQVVDTRSQLIAAEQLISGDRYTFIRDAYMQRRQYLISDGEVSEFQDDGF